MSLLAFALVQAAADPPAVIEVGVLLRWLIVPALVTALLGFMAIASYTRFHRRWMRNEESGAADLIREVLCSPGEREATASWMLSALEQPGQRHKTATWLLDRLGERHEETKGFIGRLYAVELREVAKERQMVHAHDKRIEEHKDSLEFVRASIAQQGASLSILPQLEKTFVRFEATLDKMQGAMQDLTHEMTDRLARMEGTIDTWDGRERRKNERRGDDR